MSQLRPTLSEPEARQLVVAATFGGYPLSGGASVLRHTGLLQLDPLSRVEKAHRLTCLARMDASGSAGAIDGELWSAGEATSFETWVHGMCLVPVEDWPLLRLIHERASVPAPSNETARVLAEVRAIVTSSQDGVTISDIERPGGGTTGWDWSERKHATEHMLRTGELVCTARRGTRRVYDLPERRIPGHLLSAHLSDDDILASLAMRALTAMGLATIGDIARYYNLSAEHARRGLETSNAQQVAVQGWSSVGWMLPSAESQVGACSHEPVLIGPFDNMIWDRDRTRRVFGFDYTFEAYKPKDKRVYGYYVLGLLEDGKFIGRADLRREGNDLIVLSAHAELATEIDRFRASLESALERLARQLLKR